MGGNIVDALLVGLILCNVDLLRTNRIAALIRTAALQGVLIGMILFFSHTDGFSWHVGLFALTVVFLKGVVFPFLLARTRQGVNAQRENNPFVGFPMSVCFGIAAFALSLWIGARLPLPGVSALSVPVGLTTMLTGFFLMTSRRTAITQAIGYLVLENGITVFGALAAGQAPFVVELGILLDVFLGVFVMGIAIFNINREFHHIDADRLSSLKD